MDTVKRNYKEKDEDQQEGLEHEDPRHVSSLLAEKQRPGPNEQIRSLNATEMKSHWMVPQGSSSSRHRMGAAE